MASEQVKPSQQFNPYLSPNQQDLLLAALNSQATQKSRAKAAPGDTGLQIPTSAVSQHHSSTMSGSASAVFQSPGNMDNFNPDYTPDLDYLDGDGSFDFDNADLGGEMIGGLPGIDADGNPEQHDKRKNSDEDGSPEEGDAKRQELGEGEKGSKKPGRKPLTNEPTTVSTNLLLRIYISVSCIDWRLSNAFIPTNMSSYNILAHADSRIYTTGTLFSDIAC
jgi:AP-1-like factor